MVSSSIKNYFYEKKRTFDFLLLTTLAFAIFACIKIYLSKDLIFFDDSFIYLHIAANIIEKGTASYFPITASPLLLASSPLKLISFLPILFGLNLFDISLRSMEIARFAFLSTGLVTFILFLPFWRNEIRAYLLLTLVYWILSTALGSLLEMEAGVLFYSSFTFCKFLLERSQKYKSIGVLLFLVLVSRPEIGLIAFFATIVIYRNQINVLRNIFFAYLFLGLIYCLATLLLKVYPIPSTIWTKQTVAALKMFSSHSLLQDLAPNLSRLLGIDPTAWQAYAFGWVFLCLPLVFSFFIKSTRWLIFLSLGVFIFFASVMPANFDWYYENAFIFLILLGAVVIFELLRVQQTRLACAYTLILFLTCTTVVLNNFGVNRPYQWSLSEEMGRFKAYALLAKHSGPEGSFTLPEFSNEAFRARMWQIGVVAYLAGGSAWIYDRGGLAQVGNIPQSFDSSARYLFPKEFFKNGEAEIKSTFKTNIKNFDVWGFNDGEVLPGGVKCDFIFENICIVNP